ncbi:MAG TPA: S49 family peptidase [Burkholderiaceae bacterium]|jgi:protease-4|nr:S49 family peptidase [Burkholderiaceae bacterium]
MSDSPLIPPEPGRPEPAPAAAAAVQVHADLSRLEHVVAQVAGELVRERRNERRWRMVGRAAWILVAVLVVAGLAAQHGKVATPSGPHTALIEVRGEIAEQSDASAENIVSALRNAFDEKSAQAVVLRFNSPGGSPVQSGIVNDEIGRLRKLHPNKKVYAVCEEMCASGAYYMAVAADEIYVDKASIVGSIGVLIDGFGFTGLMDKAGVERRLITAGANKGMLDPFSPLSAQQRAYAQAMIDEIHQQFIDVVHKGRGDRLHETPDTFSGLFWNGQDAVRLGLADGLGNLDYVARDVVKAEDVVDYTLQENVAERLAKRFGASIGAGIVHALQASVTLR